MMRTLQRLFKQDKEKYSVPKRVQDVVPIKRIWSDGIYALFKEKEKPCIH